MHKKIIYVDDDPEDQLIFQTLAPKTKLSESNLVMLDGSDALMEHLSIAELPYLILLDINMPEKDGKMILKELRQDERYKSIPVVIWTTSKLTEDVNHLYGLGANSYITKPFEITRMVDVMNNLANYWFDTVELPK